MPASFYFPDRDAMIWTPHFVPLPSRGPERGVFAFSALARLKPGVGLEQAQAEGATVVKGLFEDAPRVRTPLDSVRAPDLRLIPLKDEMTREVRPALLVLAGVVALVLLMAAANLANLLLARGTARWREIAIRAAIGAGRGRLIRQLLTESVLLALLGGAAGLVLAWWLQRALPAVAPADFPRLGELSIDRVVLFFTVAVSAGTGMLFGLAPVAQGLRIDLTRALSAAGVGSGGFRFDRGNRARLALAIAEIAVAVVLLVGAGLLLESFRRLIDVHPGYDPRNVMTARLALPQTKYATPGASAAFVDQVLERLAGRPEVEAAASAGTLPLGRGMMVVAFDLPNRPPMADQGPATAAVRTVSPGYLRAMGLRLVEGRWLTDSDARGGRPVILVNESFMRTYLPGEKGVGRELPVFDRPSEVIGIVGDVRHAGLDAEPQPEVYVSHRHSEAVRSPDLFIVIRTNGDPTAVVPALRAAMKSVDPNVPLESVMTMEARLSASVARPRFYAMLLAAFAALAVTLAAVGIYGVLSYGVSQRRREIGVRMAVGAEAHDVLRLVLGQGAGVVAVGLVLGLGAAAVAARAVSGLLFGVTARDPAVFAGVAVLLGSIALVACYIPARRAARVDPLEALRDE
jgi:putative ABC transport system permease protein